MKIRANACKRMKNKKDNKFKISFFLKSKRKSEGH
jgi:hypothetical protein